MPPAPPMVPGGFDFARSAWFSGLMATGSVIGPVTVIAPAPPARLDAVRQRLADHIRTRLGGSPGAIAAALPVAIAAALRHGDEDAMRDAGLTHLLSISGLHVSAVVGAVYFLTARLLALVPFLALRLRVPLVAAAMGALAGIGYTLLTGAEVPTIRSCLGRCWSCSPWRWVVIRCRCACWRWPRSWSCCSGQRRWSARVSR
jgi:competence protein ComEC